VTHPADPGGPGLPWPADRVSRAAARRAVTPPALDGRLEAACWDDADWSPRFVDLVSGAPVRYDTRAALLWDDDHLYAGFRLEQPDVTATLTERDAHIWLDDDVEVFVAGDDAYYELEVNAFGTVYEVLFEWDDATRRAAERPPELRRDHPQAAPFDGVGFRHPRGPRTGFWGFDLPGLRTAVHVDGTLNDPRDTDTGWTVEVRWPWAGLRELSGVPMPPKDGDQWRINFSRVEWDITTDGGKYRKVKGRPEYNWVWSPQGLIDMHVPSRWGYLHFSGNTSTLNK